jgi:ribosome recycling factor
MPAENAGKLMGETEERAHVAAGLMRESMREAVEDADKLLGKTENRAHSAAGTVRHTVGEAVSEADKLLSQTESRAQAAAGTMRESVREAIEDAISRFSGATEEIRQSASSIRKELEDTRGELKRGAFDLPEETRESAAAMRRAVADQIKALQELSQIVGQSSYRAEVSEPAPRPAPRAAAAQPAPAPAPQRAPRRDPAPAPRTEPQAQRAPLRGSLEPAGAAPAKSEGWVSDLLRGASREENTPAPAPVASKTPERNPRHVVESLNSLSVDIARAIDHDASVDLWRRYQRGERDVFTRRLYTLKGQQTFEEIKNKYGREPEFRDAVDRYIADFEKLLSDVARNDRDNMMTQTYLTSDTGKVYTMLAHASGRFGRD